MRRQHDGLSNVSGLVVKIPVAHTTKVTPVGFLGLEVEVLEDLRDMVPVLHEQGIGVVHDHHLEG